MLQYILTGIAGLVLGIVGMRVWQSREGSPGTPDAQTDRPAGAARIGGDAPKPGQGRLLLIGAGALAAIAAALFLFRGDPATDAPLAAPGSPAAGKQLADVDTMIARLETRLQKDSKDGEGFRMLGWSYVMTGRPEKALPAYKRALELLPDNATVHAGYGEALAGAAGGTVTPEAKAHFDKALTLDPKEPRAIYFEGLWLAQNGQQRQALDKWVALANAGSADAPWQPEVRGKIADLAAKLNVDMSGKLRTPATSAGTAGPPNADQAAAISNMPPAQQQASIDSMVEGLAAKLKANPKDAAGWAMLVRSRMVLKQDDKAAQDLAAARKALAGDAEGLATVDAAARSAGVPGA